MKSLPEINSLSTPLIKLESEFLTNHKISLFVKRIDLIHPYISGNKWYKLYYNIKEAKKLNKTTLLTFGGAYSNHIYATAAAGKEFNFKTIGIIRGEEHLPLNPTLQFAKNYGMEIHYLNRTKYKNKNNVGFLTNLKEIFGDFYLLPEGGTNNLAIKGCSEIIQTINIEFDYFCTPCGTGGTLAGLICGLNNTTKALGFSVLKGGGFLIENVNNLINTYSGKIFDNWEIILNYHFGGYAKISTELISFMNEFEKEYNITIEPIYSGKMFYGIWDLIKKEFFRPKSKIIALHTGGLQGLLGMKNEISKLSLF